jgi:ParB family chromosome partitioning protein
MPESVRKLCRLADIQSKSLLLQVVRQSEPEKMVAFVERLQRDGRGTREDARRLHKQGKGRGRPRHFVFRYEAPQKAFHLSLQFKKGQVPREEIVRALEAVLHELKSS